MYFQVVKHIHAKDTIEEAPPLGPHRNRPAASPGNSPVSPVVWEPLGIMACFNNFKFQNPWNYGEKSKLFQCFHTELSAIYPVKVAGHLQNSEGTKTSSQKQNIGHLGCTIAIRREGHREGHEHLYHLPRLSNGDVGQITGMSETKGVHLGEKKSEDVSENNGQLNLKVSKGCFFGLLKMNMEMVCLACFAI